MEITKIERTDTDVDNSIYIAKIPYQVEDDYGNTATLYRKEELRKGSLEQEKTALESQLAKVNEKLQSIRSIK